MKKGLLLITLVSGALATEAMVNMCEKAYVMKSKDNYGEIQKILNRNDKVEVLEKLGYYSISTDETSDEAQKEKNSNKPDEPSSQEESESLPAWAKLSDGYVSFKCLVSEEDFQNIQKGNVRKSSLNDTKTAKKGFSEDESGDTVAMKGVAGNAKMGNANYEALQELSIYSVNNPLETFKLFREEARLGEYK